MAAPRACALEMSDSGVFARLSLSRRPAYPTLAATVPDDGRRLRANRARRRRQAAIARLWLPCAVALVLLGPVLALVGHHIAMQRHPEQALVFSTLLLLAWELFAGFLIALMHASRSHALRRQGQLVNHVLQSLGEGVIVAGRDGVVRFANATARGLIGAEVRGAPAAVLADLLRMGCGEAAAPSGVGSRPLDRAVAGDVIEPQECFVRTRAAPDGVWLSVSGGPIRDETGAPRGGVVVLRDVSVQHASQLRLHERKLEMDLAAAVQRSLYPCAPPQLEGFDLAGAVYPAEETCGDYYDYIRLPGGTMCLAVGDVSGHGLGPALVMAEARAYVRSLAAAGTVPRAILTRCNRMLAQDLVDGLFVTLLLLNVDPHTRMVSYASAGHTPGLLLDANGALKAELGCTGRPLGLFADSRYEARNGMRLEEGDVLVLMTDGATEAASPTGERFESRGVVDVVCRHRREPAGEILERVHEAIETFSDGRSSRDDVTLLVCKCASSGVRAVGRPSRVVAHGRMARR